MEQPVQPKEFLELRSEEVQELITKVPSWLIRWGTTVVFIVLILVLLGTWLIHYPDLVHASFKLTSANAPKAVLAKTDGRIVRLFAREGSIVKTGTRLLYLESTAQHEEVLKLIGVLRKIAKLPAEQNSVQLNLLDLRSYSHLGELQSNYQTFEQTYAQLRTYSTDGFYLKKKNLLQQELVDLQSLAKNLRNQQAAQQREVNLAQDEYRIQQTLARQKVISPLELKREESKKITRQLPYQQTASALINNQNAQRAKQEELLELDKQIEEKRDNFLQAANTLLSTAEAWKSKYVVEAPMNGRVYFPSSLQINQPISLNQELLYIAPRSSNYYGELRIPQNSLGKVQVNQPVIIKFLGYPYQEYGSVQGRIESIAEISLRDSIFLAKVVLPKGLTTTYNKRLLYKTGMAASAEIITNDSRLIEKLFYQLRKITNGK